MPADSRMSMETRRVHDSLTFDWQPLEPIMQAAMLLVPPGKALRRYQSRPNVSSYIHQLTEEEQMRSGAREVVRDYISKIKRTGRLESRLQGSAEIVRWRERRAPVPCPHCGYFVGEPVSEVPPQPHPERRQPAEVVDLSDRRSATADQVLEGLLGTPLRRQ